MDNDLVLIATTEDVAKYADKTCIEAEADFRREFILEDRAFVNYFFHMISDDKRRTFYCDNYSIITSDDFNPKPNLDGMVYKYLNVGIPGTSIQMVMPPLIISNPESRNSVLKAFEKAGYHKTVDLQKNQ